MLEPPVKYVPLLCRVHSVVKLTSLVQQPRQFLPTGASWTSDSTSGSIVARRETWALISFLAICADW